MHIQHPASPNEDFRIASPKNEGTAIARRLRVFAVIAWVFALIGEAIGGTIIIQSKASLATLVLLAMLTLGIVTCAISGAMSWRAANMHNPADLDERMTRLVQHELGTILSVLAFAPLALVVLLDKEADKTNKILALSVASAVAMAVAAVWIRFGLDAHG